MSIKDRLANKSATIGSVARPLSANVVQGNRAKTGAGQLMQSLPMLAEKDDEIARLKEQLDIAAGAAPPLEISLADLKEVPGRRRKLTSEQFNELKENLRNNTLVSAITVRPSTEGGYEIISGHNRVAAYRELGKEKILAVSIHANDTDSELASFYANLLQSGLPDYEKYIGFKRRQKATGKTQKELAAEAGVTASFVSLLMTFDKLPEEVTHQLNDRPELIGANAAEAFAKLIEQGRKSQVIESIANIADGTLSQAAALRKASKDEASPTPKAESKRYRSGKTVFAEVRGAGKILRISFCSEEERESIEEAIGEVLARFASEKSSRGKIN